MGIWKSETLASAAFKMPARGFRNISPPITLPQIAECFTYGRRAFRDFRSVPEAGRPREQVENHGRVCTQVLFLCKSSWDFFTF
jgi:hypothetical protein